jgi:hypothetical protein
MGARPPLADGTALDTVGAPADPSVLRALTEGHMVMFGSIGCVLLALVAAASGYVTFASGALPNWTGWVAYAVALLNLIAVPTMFGGKSDTSFVSAGGTGSPSSRPSRGLLGSSWSEL